MKTSMRTRTVAATAIAMAIRARAVEPPKPKPLADRRKRPTGGRNMHTRWGLRRISSATRGYISHKSAMRGSTQPRNPENVPYGPLNDFWHCRKLGDATYRDGGSPNQDTLYSTAWLDLRKEPIILSYPDMGDRFFTFEMGDMSSDNFAVVGQRPNGNKARKFAIVGPGVEGHASARRRRTSAIHHARGLDPR